MSEQHLSQAATLRARLSHLERRLQHTPGEASRIAPECLRELEHAVSRLEAAYEQLKSRDGELRHLRAGVQSVEQRLSALVGMVDAGYLLTDLTGLILDANATAGRLLNISRKSLIGRPFALFVAGERIELMARLGTVANEGTATDLELRLRPRERQMLQVRTRVCAVRDGSDRTSGLQWLLMTATPLFAGLEDDTASSSELPSA